MLKQSAAVFGLAAVLAWTVSAQDPRIVIDSASKAIGVDRLRTVEYSADGMDFALGQAQNPASPWPKFVNKSYTRSIDFNTLASRVDRVRVQGENPPRGGGQQPIIGDQPQSQTIVIGAETPWVQQLEIWMLPHGFVRAALTNNSTVKSQTLNGKRYDVVTFTGQNKAQVNGYINDQRLVERVETWIDTAYLGDTLFDRYREPIWRFFARRVADPGRAEELAQETFLAVIKGARRYEPRAAFRSYLFGIAFNVMLAARRQARGAVEDPVGDFDPPAASSDPANVIWVRQALAGLDRDEREVLMMREFDALSYDEIASLQGVPVGTVRSRLFRAREALRVKLSGGKDKEDQVQRWPVLMTSTARRSWRSSTGSSATTARPSSGRISVNAGRASSSPPNSRASRPRCRPGTWRRRRRRRDGGTAEPRHLALQGSAPAVAAAGRRTARPDVQFRVRVSHRRQEDDPAGAVVGAVRSCRRESGARDRVLGLGCTVDEVGQGRPVRARRRGKGPRGPAP